MAQGEQASSVARIRGGQSTKERCMQHNPSLHSTATLRNKTEKCAQVNRHAGSGRLALSYLGTSQKRFLGAAQAL